MDELNIAVEEEEAEEEASWMTTFADLMSLLLTFFVLLLSFAQMDIVKFQDALGSVKEAFGGPGMSQQFSISKNNSMIEKKYQSFESMVKPPIDMKIQPFQNRTARVVVKENDEVLRKLKESIKKNNMEEQVKAEVTGRGVVVRVKGQLMFESGSDVLRKAAYPLLDDLIGVIEKFPYSMSVEGHTDDTNISTARFPSNWELSTARAISTLRYIMESGRISSDRLGASGYADTRPIASNGTPEGRQKNRRVEFIFYKN